MSAPSKKATYADLADLPENVVGEILDGELLIRARPAGPHTFATAALGMLLGGPFQFGRGGPGGWWILDEPEVHLHDDVLVPDLAGWKRERLPTAPEGSAFTVVPDWVCEVASPSTARVDRLRKMPIYAREGVSHVWLVDPMLKTLEAFELEHGRWVVVGAHGDEGTARVAPFDAIELELGGIFQR
jgi:Uma2 family endonuclease